MHCRDCKCVRSGIRKGILCPATGKKNPPEFSEISRNISTLLNSFAGYWKLDREFTCRNRVTFKGKRARGWSWNIFGSRLLRALTSLTSQRVGRLCTAAVVIFILPDVKAEANSLQPSQSFFYLFFISQRNIFWKAQKTQKEHERATCLKTRLLLPDTRDKRCFYASCQRSCRVFLFPEMPFASFTPRAQVFLQQIPFRHSSPGMGNCV